MALTLLLALALFIVGIVGRLELVVGLSWLLAGGVLLNYLWLRRSLSSLRLTRTVQTQAYSGDTIPVEISLNNRGRLPLPWLTLRDYVPPELEAHPRPEWLLNIRSREKTSLKYEIVCKRRGRLLLGPFEGSAGTALDIQKDPTGAPINWNARSRLVVYPTIVPLERLGLPSRVALGNLRTRQPLLPDPSRVAGVRDYQPGDDPRHIDWRNSARVGMLQVKQFERTRVVPLAIFLDLRLADYDFGRRQAGEAAIVVAASLMFRANELNQPFGLFSNGFDPGWDNRKAAANEPGPEGAPRQGVGWLNENLEILAGIEMRHETLPLEKLIGRWSSKLPWGATVAVVALEPSPELVSELLRLRKAGFSPLAIFTARALQTGETLSQIDALRNLGIQTYAIAYPAELNYLAAGQLT